MIDGKGAPTDICRLRSLVKERDGQRPIQHIELVTAIPGTDGTTRYAMADSPQAQYLLTCARYRKALETYLLEGELLGELTLQYATSATGLPPVYSAVWRAPDGRVLLLLANVTGEAQTIDYTFNGTQWGLTAGKLTLARLQPGKRETLGEMPPAFTRHDPLQPREILALELMPK